MRKSPRIALFLAALTFLLALSPALAQFDPGEYNIEQEDQLVGTIFVPPRDAEVCDYLEYWFLFDEYRYPGPDDPVETTIEFAEERDPEAERRMREGDGYWITVEATEHRPECDG